MAKSIMQSKHECYICGATTGLEEHHVFRGSQRKHAEEDGLKVYLCYEHHRGQTGVHNNRELELKLKREGQIKYEEIHSHDEYMQRYRRNYIDLDVWTKCK